MIIPARLTITLVCLSMLASGCTERRSRPADEHSKASAPQRLGGTWQLEWMGDVDKPTPVLPNTSITLTFASDEKRISGFAGCNRYMGTYASSSDHTLGFSAIGSTKMMCADPGIEQQEMNYLQLLQKADQFAFVAGTLLITHDGGAKGLKYDVPKANSSTGSGSIDLQRLPERYAQWSDRAGQYDWNQSSLTSLIFGEEQ